MARKDGQHLVIVSYSNGTTDVERYQKDRDATLRFHEIKTRYPHRSAILALWQDEHDAVQSSSDRAKALVEDLIEKARRAQAEIESGTEPNALRNAEVALEEAKTALLKHLEGK